MKKIIITLALVMHATEIHTNTNHLHEITIKAPAPHNIRIRVFDGQSARAYFDDIARIRLTLFKEYPYLYEGTVAREAENFEPYFMSQRVTILLVFDNDQVVGFINSIPLEEEDAGTKAPFIEQGLPIEKYVYIGEVMLYPHYRGLGIAKTSLAFLEQKARTEGFEYTTFITVERPEDHPCKTHGYQPLDAMWQHLGYARIPNAYAYYTWSQVDTQTPTNNVLAVWSKKLL